jgi:hypothetical protein
MAVSEASGNVRIHYKQPDQIVNKFFSFFFNYCSGAASTVGHPLCRRWLFTPGPIT